MRTIPTPYDRVDTQCGSARASRMCEVSGSARRPRPIDWVATAVTTGCGDGVESEQTVVRHRRSGHHLPWCAARASQGRLQDATVTRRVRDPSRVPCTPGQQESQFKACRKQTAEHKSVPAFQVCKDMRQMMFGRAFSQHGEIGTASRCRGIDMLYGGYRVVHEVEAAPQRPRWGQEAYRCSGRCSGAAVGI